MYAAKKIQMKKLSAATSCTKNDGRKREKKREKIGARH